MKKSVITLFKLFWKTLKKNKSFILHPRLLEKSKIQDFLFKKFFSSSKICFFSTNPRISDLSHKNLPIVVQSSGLTWSYVSPWPVSPLHQSLAWKSTSSSSNTSHWGSLKYDTLPSQRRHLTHLPLALKSDMSLVWPQMQVQGPLGWPQMQV